MNDKAEKIMDLRARLERLTSELDQYEKIALVLAVEEQAHELVAAHRNMQQLIECIGSIIDSSGEDENSTSNAGETLH